MRILHLIDHQPPTTLALLAQSLGRLGDAEQSVFLLGHRSLQRSAEATGIQRATRIACPPRRSPLAWPNLARRARAQDRCDIVHCWSTACLTLATLIWPKTPRILSLTTPPTPAAARWLRALIGERGSRTTLLSTSAIIRQALLTAGLPEPRVHVLRPGIDMGMVRHNARDGLRRRWAVTSDDTTVIALLSDPAPAADALPAALAIELADQTPTHGVTPPPQRVQLVTHPAQHNRLRAHRAARQLGRPTRIIQEPRLDQPWAVLPGCDAALAIGPDAGGLSLIWAMSANVPVVGEATYAVSEVVEDRHSALLAKPDSPKDLARRVQRLTNDPQLAWRLRDTARHEAYSFFSRQRYCQSVQAVYRQIVNDQAVRVPQLEVTGGLRFAGRA